jgi:hypothetical protein
VHNLKPRRQHFADLLKPLEDARPWRPFWPVSQDYKLDGGRIYAVGDDAWIDSSPAEDDELFLSFARLGARGEPSDESVLWWVRRHGLLWHEDGTIDPEGTSMELYEFRREVRCVRQMFELYLAIENRDLDILERLLVNGERRLVRDWPTPPQTVIDKCIRAKSLISEEHAARFMAGRDPNFDHREFHRSALLVRGWELLRLAIHEKMEGVKPTFAHHHLRTAEPASDESLAFRRGWYCRDLLSAIYLSFYLFVTGGKCISFCETCGKEMQMTRSDKRYCSPTCRSNARHNRNRQRT